MESPTYDHRNITLTSKPLSLMLYNPVQHNYVKKIVMFSGLPCTLHTVSKTTEIEERCPIKWGKKRNNNNKKKKTSTKTTYCYTKSSTGEEEV